jgi:hypothetical protein
MPPVGVKASLLITIWSVSGGALITVCGLSVAVTEKEKVPVIVGVPVTDPSLPTLSPGGGLPRVTFHE